ncbi:unnamed protein product [Phaedon cochleariae]|uniref:Transmembrane protein 135 N-terminal domain-containing protein n=1 Tax=Phaedon cochleariae TaxID=80249 RepID=A0A9P0DHA8_PHACE|nr:unnamed protein product [Phaedon cochleariae]
MPAVISKELFYEKVKYDTSCDIFHAWCQDCRAASFSQIWLTELFTGLGKFFLPIYLIKLIYTYKRNDLKTLLLNLVKSELRSIAYGLAMGTLLVSSICFLRFIFGRIYYYNVALIPGFFSGLSILVESEENQVLDTLIFFNSFVETILRRMRLDKLMETLLFMGVSGTLMHLLEQRSTVKMEFTHLWFYVPPSKNLSDKDIEDLSDSCVAAAYLQTDLFRSFLKYFSLGYGINFVRKMIPKVGNILKKPSELLKVLFNKSNAYFGLFIGSYVTIYRVLTSIFSKNPIVGEKYHGFVAGLLSGISYSISPNLQVLVIAITTSLQMIYACFCKKMKITNHYWQRFFVYALTHGIMIHNKFFYPDTCSPYYKNMIDACTNNVSKKIYEHLLTKFFLV